MYLMSPKIVEIWSFVIPNGRYTFRGAVERCAQDGWTLAKPKSSEIEGQLDRVMRAGGVNDIWIGVIGDYNEGHKYTDGILTYGIISRLFLTYIVATIYNYRLTL